MKLYKVSQKNFAVLGVNLNETNQNNLYNWNILVFFFLFVLCVILALFFLIYDADNFAQYIEGIYIVTAAFAIFLDAVSIAIHVMKFSIYIEGLEKLVISSKSNLYILSKVFVL